MTRADGDYWRGGQVRGYDRKQRLLVPKKDEMLDVVVDFIPFEVDAPILVVDVGSGPGTLSAKVLRRFPCARVVLVDSSGEMLAEAEDRLRELGPRASFLREDFNNAGWSGSIGSPDVVVSSIALHFLQPGTRAPFFRTVHAVLAARGCFINAGVFLSTDPFVQRRSDQRKIEHRRAMLLELEGRDVSFDELVQRDEAESRSAGVDLYSFADQTRWLVDAGFDSVEVVWRYYSLGVFVAFKESAEPGARDEHHG